jgi:ABC-type sugar transport system substrate-binding protein
MRPARARAVLATSGLVIAAVAASASVSANAATKAPTRLQKVTAEVQSWRKPQLLLPPALKQAPKSGKKIAFLQGGTGTGPILGAAIQAAAKQLHWTYLPIATSPTPDSISAAFQQAIQQKPDAIIAQGLQLSVIQSSLKATKAAGIPVFEVSNADPATGMKGNGIVASINGAGQTQLVARDLAKWIYVNSKGGPTSILLAEFPFYTLQQVFAKAFKAEEKALCPQCKVNTFASTPADIGTNVGKQAVSAYQQHQDTKYLVFGLGPAATGVSSAFRNAGIKGVRIVGQNATATQFNELAAGTNTMWMFTFSLGVLGYRVVDSVVRYLEPSVANGEVSTPDTQPIIINASNIKNYNLAGVTDFNPFPNYQASFAKAWKLK